MAAMDVGWSDLGSWTQLVAALGGAGTGRVVSPNEAAHADEGDLIVDRQAGKLAVIEGPRDILAPSPVALLSGAAALREPVDALINRVAAWEARL
jgi:hypothetical protein